METYAFLVTESYESSDATNVHLVEFGGLTQSIKLTLVGVSASVMFSALPANALITNGSRGTEVLQLQRQLISLGYSVKESGIYDKQTRYSVTEFQRATNLKVDGIVGKNTAAKITQVINEDDSIEKPTKKKIASGDENVIKIQENLKAVGAYKGKINGILDTATIEAIDEARSISCLPLSNILKEDIQQNQW